MGFDYDAILQERKSDAAANRRFLVEQLLNIPEIRQIAEEALNPEAEA